MTDMTDQWKNCIDARQQLAPPANAAPAKSTTTQGLPAMLCAGLMYRHFEESTATVSYVLDEFYWRVCTDEKVTIKNGGVKRA